MKAQEETSHNRNTWISSLYRERILFFAAAILITSIFWFLIATNTLKLGIILGTWMWDYNPTKVIHKLWFPIIVSLFSASSLFFLFRKNVTTDNKWLEFFSVLAVWMLGVAISLSIFSLRKLGFDEIPGLIVHSGRTSYFTDALSIKDVGVFLENHYKLLPQLTHRSQTHGPGPVLFFWVILRLMSGAVYLREAAIKLGQMLNIDLVYLAALIGKKSNSVAIAASIFSGFFMVFLYNSAVVPLYYFTKKFYRKTVASLAVLFFIVTPNLILFTPQMAQVYILFSILIIMFFYSGLKGRNLYYFVMSGLVYAVGIFFSLEFLVLLPFIMLIVGGYIISSEWQSHQGNDYVLSTKGRVLGGFKALAVFTSTVLVFYFVLYFATGFNVIKTYKVALAIHNELEFVRSYWKWLWANYVEFFAYFGIPFTLLFLKGTVSLVKNGYYAMITKARGKIDILLTAFVIVFIMLDLSGINRGETSRLWIFLIPYLLIIIGKEIESLMEIKEGGWRLGVIAAVLIIVTLELAHAILLRSILRIDPLGYVQ